MKDESDILIAALFLLFPAMSQRKWEQTVDEGLDCSPHTADTSLRAAPAG